MDKEGALKKYNDNERPEAVCYDCGEDYSSDRFPDLVIDDIAWEAINPTFHKGCGLLCPNCINARLEAAGLDNVDSNFRSGPMVKDTP